MFKRKIRKTYVERRKEEIDKLSDEELLQLEKKLYYSNGASVIFGLGLFLLCIFLFGLFVR